MPMSGRRIVSRASRPRTAGCWDGSICPGSCRPPIAPGQEDVLNGIAYDVLGDRLFVTGKLWPKLFEIKVVPKLIARTGERDPSASRTRRAFTVGLLRRRTRWTLTSARPFSPLDRKALGSPCEFDIRRTNKFCDTDARPRLPPPPKSSASNRHWSLEPDSVPRCCARCKPSRSDDACRLQTNTRKLSNSYGWPPLLMVVQSQLFFTDVAVVHLAQRKIRSDAMAFGILRHLVGNRHAQRTRQHPSHFSVRSAHQIPVIHRDLGRHGGGAAARCRIGCGFRNRKRQPILRRLRARADEAAA